MCRNSLFSQLTLPSYQTIIVSTFCRTKPFTYIYNLLGKIMPLQLSTKYLIVVVQEFRWVLVMFFTFLCIDFYSYFLPTQFSMKMLGNMTLDLIF